MRRNVRQNNGRRGSGRRIRRHRVRAAGQAGEDRPARHAGRPVRRGRAGRHARRRARDPRARRRGRRPQDRADQGVLRRQARRRGQRRAQAGRAGQGRPHGRPPLGRRGHRGEELLQDPAQCDLHQRRLGRAGHHAAGPVAQLLPLEHRRRAVDVRPGQGGARQGLQARDGDRRGLRLPVLAGAGLHGRVLQARRQGAGQGLGAARRQGLLVGHRAHPERRRRAGGGARRRRRGELPQPVRAGRRRQADDRRLDHGEPGRPELQGQAPRLAGRHAVRRPAGRRVRRARVEEIRRRLQEELPGWLPEPVAVRGRVLHQHEGDAGRARGGEGRSLRRPQEVPRGHVEDDAQAAHRRAQAGREPAGDRQHVHHRGGEGQQGNLFNKVLRRVDNVNQTLGTPPAEFKIGSRDEPNCP